MANPSRKDTHLGEAEAGAGSMKGARIVMHAGAKIFVFGLLLAFLLVFKATTFRKRVLVLKRHSQ
jgi:hypothetical protein